MNNDKLFNLKKAFEKLYGISLEKYHEIIEKKSKEKHDKDMKEVEQNIDKNLSKW